MSPKGVLACLLVVGCQSNVAPKSDALRLVSLSPELTEAVFALGAGDALVGVSDYCRYPEAAAAKTKVGTGLTPQLEAIARLKPSHVLTGRFAGQSATQVSKIAPVVELPWLTLDEVKASLTKLGELTGKVHEAKVILDALQKTLAVAEPTSGPRVLLLIGDPGAGDLFYIKEASMHGRALWAAGGLNAVTEKTKGPPSLSLEELIRLNPDQIIVLESKPGQAQALVSKLSGLDVLKAAQDKRIDSLTAPEAFSTGPRIIQLVDKLRQHILRTQHEPR